MNCWLPNSTSLDWWIFSSQSSLQHISSPVRPSVRPSVVFPVYLIINSTVSFVYVVVVAEERNMNKWMSNIWRCVTRTQCNPNAANNIYCWPIRIFSAKFFFFLNKNIILKIIKRDIARSVKFSFFLSPKQIKKAACRSVTQFWF